MSGYERIIERGGTYDRLVDIREIEQSSGDPDEEIAFEWWDGLKQPVKTAFFEISRGQRLTRAEAEWVREALGLLPKGLGVKIGGRVFEGTA